MNLPFAQTVDVPPDALSALTDALAQHSWVVAACVAVLILAPLLLKAFNVKVPFLDPIVNVLLGIAKSFGKPKEAAAEVPPRRLRASRRSLRFTTSAS